MKKSLESPPKENIALMGFSEDNALTYIKKLCESLKNLSMIKNKFGTERALMQLILLAFFDAEFDEVVFSIFCQK